MGQQKLVFFEKKTDKVISKDPELRFNFDDKWEEVILKDIGNSYTGLSGKSKEDFNKGNSIFIPYRSIFNDIILDDSNFESVDIQESEKQNLVAKGDIFFTGSSETPNEVGMASVLLKDLDNCYLNSFCFGFRLNSFKDYDPLFLTYYFSSPKFKTKLFKLAQGSTRFNLSKKELLKEKIYMPKKEEQIRISKFLNLIDKKIELLEKSLNSYQKYYECVSNNYFDNITCDNIVKFKDIISKGKAGGTPKSSNKSFYDGEIPFLSINDMTTQGKYINYTSKMISEEGLNNSSAWIIPKNSLLYSIYASIGFVSINKIELTTSQAIYGVILKEEINQDFIYHYLKNFKRHIYKYIETGTQGNLNSKIVNDIPIKLPSNMEQKFYADFFNKFDEIIEIKLNEIDKFKDFKKGLLQKMFV